MTKLRAIGSPLERAAKLNLGARHKELSMTQTITKSSKAIVTAALAQVPAISAASIIAKTTRDRIMVQMDRLYPDYEFARHKGYGTEIHRERLQQHGPCVQHRRSFAPVRMAG